MITRMDLVDRLAAVTGDAASYDEVMTSVALIRAAINYLLPEPVGVDEAEREDVANFVHALPNGLWKDEVAVRIHARARAIERAVHADSARIAHLTHERDIARRDCAALKAEVEALRKRVLPALTDEEIIALDCLRLTVNDEMTDIAIASSSVIEFARAILAAAPQPPAQVEAAPGSHPGDNIEAMLDAEENPMPPADGWIENTGTQPVANDVLVEAEFSDGGVERYKAGHISWAIEHDDCDIIRWRLAAPASETAANKEGA